MSDIVVTVPKTFTHPCAPGKGLSAWIAEGDAAGDVDDEWGPDDYCFSVAGGRPNINPGERVYIVCEGRIRGYAPLVELQELGPAYWGLIRSGGAVAVTIPERVQGFRGWRYRWWKREDEVPFPDWRTAK